MSGIPGPNSESPRPNTMSYAALDTLIENHAADFIGRLSALCRVPSIAAEGGPAMAEAAEQVAALCRWAGVSAELAPTGGAPVVLGRVGAGPRGLLIYNHYDVQPPDPLEAWVSPPFEPACARARSTPAGWPTTRPTWWPACARSGPTSRSSATCPCGSSSYWKARRRSAARTWPPSPRRMRT